jgi:hypothetical protein
MTTKVDTFDQELAGIKTVYEALAPLDDRGRRFVLKTVAERLGTSLSLDENHQQREDQDQRPPLRSGPEARSAAPPTPSGQTPKEFLREKSPTSEVHRIACLAYYLTHSKGQSQFKTKDLSQLNIDAGQSPMSNASVTVANAEKGRLLAPVGRGKKQITTLGEDVVKALPNREAVKAAMSARRKPRKRRAKKDATK